MSGGISFAITGPGIRLHRRPPHGFGMKTDRFVKQGTSPGYAEARNERMKFTRFVKPGAEPNLLGHRHRNQ